MLKPTIFREYDIRGIADSEMESGDIRLLGQALGTFIRRRSGGTRVALGRDVRLSSTRLRDALSAGLAASGCNVIDAGVVPTPVVYHAANRLATDGAVMITGSHNPPEYNGFKTVVGSGTIYGDDIQEIRRIIESGDYETGWGPVETYDAVGPYVADLAGRFRFPRRIKVVFD